MHASYESCKGDFSYTDLESMSPHINNSVKKSRVNGSILRASVTVLGALSILLLVLFYDRTLNSGLMKLSRDILKGETTDQMAAANFVVNSSGFVDLPLDHSSVHIVASNEYGVFRGQYPFFDVYAGSQLIEPFKQTTITLHGSLVESGLYTFQWQLNQGPVSAMSAVGAARVILSVSSPGLFDFSLHFFTKEEGKYVGTYKTTLISRLEPLLSEYCC